MNMVGFGSLDFPMLLF